MPGISRKSMPEKMDLLMKKPFTLKNADVQRVSKKCFLTNEVSINIHTEKYFLLTNEVVNDLQTPVHHCEDFLVLIEVDNVRS